MVYDLKKILADDASVLFGKLYNQLSHEIRNSLNTIVGFSELLLLACPDEKIKDDTTEMVKKILTAGKDIEKIFKDIDFIYDDSSVASTNAVNISVLETFASYKNHEAVLWQKCKLKINIVNNADFTIQINPYNLNRIFYFILMLLTKLSKNKDEKIITVNTNTADKNIIFSIDILEQDIYNSFNNNDLKLKNNLYLIFLNQYIEKLDLHLSFSVKKNKIILSLFCNEQAIQRH